MMQKINKNGFSQCAGAYIERLRKEGRYSTAHVYKNALFSFSKFCGTLNIIVQASHARMFTLLWTASLRVRIKAQYDFYLYAYAS